MKEWIKEALIKRKAQFSTVVVFKTRDPKRFPEFVRSVYNEFSQVYGYLVWKGLVRFRQHRDGLSYEKIKSATGSIPIPSSVRSMEAALNFMDELFTSSRNVLFVIQAHGKGDVLAQALRAWMFDESMYGRGHTIAVFTEDPELILDDATLKYAILVRVPPSTEEERREILKGVLKTTKRDEKIDDTLVKITAGLTLHEIEGIALESVYRFGRLDPKVLVTYKYEIIRKVGILDVEDPKFGFEAVGGYDAVKRFVEENIVRVLRDSDIAEKLGLRAPRGLLFFGPPGTGKTLFARALAKELGLPFLRLRTERIVSKWYGESERNLAKALELAEEVAPCVLFVDEIDRFGQRGGLGEHEATRRMFSILLEWLGDERRNTIVLGTSVAYDEPVVIRVNGVIKVVRIGELVDSYFEGDEDWGEVPVENIEVLTLDSGKVEFRRVKYVYRHPADGGKLLKIKGKLGAEIKVTDNHSVFVVRDGKLVLVRASEIRRGDYLISPKVIGNYDCEKELTVDPNHAKKIEGGVELIEVVSVEPVDYGRKWVYDLSVDGTESFFAGKVPVLCHNTNRPQDLDEAFIRVGRFDYLVPILLPDEDARLQILRVHTEIARKVPLSEDVDLQDLAKRTELFSGAELEELVLRAARNALKDGRTRVTGSDFEEALSTFRIDYEVRWKEVEEYVSLAERYCNDARFLKDLTQSVSSRIEAFRNLLENK